MTLQLIAPKNWIFRISPRLSCYFSIQSKWLLIWSQMTVKTFLNIMFQGPGCNHQNSHYLTTYGKFFENSWFFRPKPSIYTQLPWKKYFFENSAQNRLLGVQKLLKMEKTHFWTFLIFFLENRKWHPFFYFIFPLHIG